MFLQSVEELITSHQYPLTLVSTLFAALGLRKVFNHLGTDRSRSLGNKESARSKEPSLESRKPGNIWNTVLFFPDYLASDLDSTTQQFFWYFAEAKQHKRGIIVQLIVGNEYSAKILRERANLPCGVVPRKPGTPDTDQIMHHKFVVIDDEAVITGSLNWTIDGFMNNSENMCVTTHQNTVQLYQTEFLKLKQLSEDAKAFY